MHSSDDAFLEQIRLLRTDYPGDPDGFRKALEVRFLPMVRCALRSGAGHPSVVRWVRSQAVCEPGKKPDPVRAAPPLVRLLCDRILERLDPLSGRETIVEAFDPPFRRVSA